MYFVENASEEVFSSSFAGPKESLILEPNKVEMKDFEAMNVKID